MPPRGHSHSSHRSSSHHRSSGHHSSSSHRNVTIIPRKTTPSVARFATKQVVRRNHNYFFINVGGNNYKRGVYDEQGTRYDALASYNGVKKEYITNEFTCEYCGSVLTMTFKNGESPHCPNCGAVLNVAIDDYLDTNNYRVDCDSSIVTEVDYDKAKSDRNIKVFCLILIIGVITPFLLSFLPDILSKKTMYVQPLGREAVWLTKYDSWYDKETDCYFYHNNIDGELVWQYWYEGISSNYGDYGWMEYDIPEKQWYIEEADSDWVVLPSNIYEREKYRLWHFDEE